MTDEQLLRRFRDVLERASNPMVRGSAVGITFALGMAEPADIAVYLDEFVRLWRELRLESHLT